MLDTVPSGVELTDVITPLPVKPSSVKLVMDGDTLQLFGLVRVRIQTTKSIFRLIFICVAVEHNGRPHSHCARALARPL
jgi:hypothetical protein